MQPFSLAGGGPDTRDPFRGLVSVFDTQLKGILMQRSHAPPIQLRVKPAPLNRLEFGRGRASRFLRVKPPPFFSLLLAPPNLHSSNFLWETQLKDLHESSFHVLPNFSLPFFLRSSPSSPLLTTSFQPQLFFLACQKIHPPIHLIFHSLSVSPFF